MFEAGPQIVLLGEKDVAQHDAGDLAPAVALGQEGKPPLIERHPPAELLEEGRQVRLGPGLRRCSVGFELRLEGCAQPSSSSIPTPAMAHCSSTRSCSSPMSGAFWTRQFAFA